MRNKTIEEIAATPLPSGITFRVFVLAWLRRYTPPSALEVLA